MFSKIEFPNQYPMLSISEFSRICKVSAKTLRYYDEIGLIKPEEIGDENGYRYYSLAQLKDMLLISQLKEYRFTLEEIKVILSREQANRSSTIYKALKEKHRVLAEEYQKLAELLKHLTADIDIVAADRNSVHLPISPPIEVELVQVPPINILSLQKTMTRADYEKGYGPFFHQLYGQLSAEDGVPLGPPMAIYHNPRNDFSGNDAEFGIPVKAAIKGCRILPGGLCAKAILKGDYRLLTFVYTRILEWIAENEYEWQDYSYEVYVTDPEAAGRAAEIITEIYFPIRKK